MKHLVVLMVAAMVISCGEREMESYSYYGTDIPIDDAVKKAMIVPISKYSVSDTQDNNTYMEPVVAVCRIKTALTRLKKNIAEGFINQRRPFREN